MGLTSLESLDEFIAVNRRNYDAYRTRLADLPGVTLAALRRGGAVNYQYVVRRDRRRAAAAHARRAPAVLWAENVLARRYFYPGCHRMEPYRSLYPDAGVALPETERLRSRPVAADRDRHGSRICGGGVRDRTPGARPRSAFAPCSGIRRPGWRRTSVVRF